MNYKRTGGQAAQSGRPARAKDGRFVLKATAKEGSLDAHYYQGCEISYARLHNVWRCHNALPAQRIELIF